MVILGIQPLDFETKDGNRITGYNIYFGESIENGVGVRTNKVFLRTEKMKKEYYKYFEDNAEVLGFVGSNGKIAGFIPVD